MNNILVIPVLVLILTVGLAPAYAQSEPVPKWIKGVAVYWTEGNISDLKFIKAIEYLIELGVISVDHDLPVPVAPVPVAPVPVAPVPVAPVPVAPVPVAPVPVAPVPVAPVPVAPVPVAPVPVAPVPVAPVPVAPVPVAPVPVAPVPVAPVPVAPVPVAPVPVAPVPDNNTIEYTYFENGDVKSSTEYYDNGYEKLITEYYESGNEQSITEYYESGNEKSYTYYYYNGNLARVHEFDVNGIIKSSAIYYDNENLELKKMWQYYDNGNFKSRVFYDKSGNITYSDYYDESGNKTYDDGYRDGSKEIIKSTPKLIINELSSYVKVDQDRYVEGDTIKINGLIGIVLPSTEYDIEILINTRTVDELSSGWVCYSLEEYRAGNEWFSINDFIMSDDGLFSISCKISDTSQFDESDYFKVHVGITEIIDRHPAGNMKYGQGILDLISNEFLIVQDKNNN